MASGSQKNPSTVSKSLDSGNDITTPLTMSDNFQHWNLAATTRAQQLSVPVVHNAPSLTGSVCTSSRASAAAMSSAWLLQADSGTLIQPLAGSAHLYHHPGTNMSGFPGQSHLSMPAASASGAVQWHFSGSAGATTSSRGGAMVTTLYQGTSVTSTCMAAQYVQMSHVNAIIPLYQTQQGTLVQYTSSQSVYQGYSLSLPYQGGRQVYYYVPTTLGPQVYGQGGPCLQSSGTGAHAGGGACVPKQQIMMVPKENHPSNVPPAVPTCDIHDAVSIQSNPEMSFQVVEGSKDTHTNLMVKTSQGLQAESQTFGLPQTAELAKSCTLESNLSPECWDKTGSPFQSPSRFLNLPATPRAKQSENENVDDVQTELSQPLEAYQITKDKEEDPLVLPFKSPYIGDICSPIETLCKPKTPGYENDNLGERSPSLEDPWQLEEGLASSIGSADMMILGEDVCLPQLLSPLRDTIVCDIPSGTNTNTTGNIQLMEVQEKASVRKGRTGPDKKNRKKGTDSIDGAPKAKIQILGVDVCLPPLLSPLRDTDLCDDPPGTDNKPTGNAEFTEVQEKATVKKGCPGPDKKNRKKGSDSIDGAPKAKIQHEDPEFLEKGEVCVGSAVARDKTPDITVKHSRQRAKRAAPSRPMKAKVPGHEDPKEPRERKFTKSDQQVQSASQVKAGEKPALPRTKRKGRAPEICQAAFEKPRTSLGKYMVESVQVFHALGKKMEQKTGGSSSRPLGNTHSTKELNVSQALKSGPHIPRQGLGPEKTQDKEKEPEGTANTECASPSNRELPSPGKVKLVPLPFCRLDKPQPHHLHRELPSLPSRRDPEPAPARPPSNSAQPAAMNPPQPAPTSASFGAPKPAGLISTNLHRPGVQHPAQPMVSQSAASCPAPDKTSSSTSLHKEPVSTVPDKPHSPPPPWHKYLLEDFSRQPIPWVKVDFPGPVESTPITDEQRPEREAMKRQAQRERENAAQYTALGRVQFFVQREKDMEISDYYGYIK